MPKRTHQPKKIRRLKKHGWRHRQATSQGRRVIKSRRQKGRRRLTA